MIKRVYENKKEFLSLLLLGDEQESMIDKYLERGEMFALYADDIVVAVCVVTDEEEKTLEIKNIAVSPEFQGRGYGKELINFIINTYKNSHEILLVGTGDSTLTMPFYKKCGFKESHRIKSFFKDNYDHPIYEAGVELVDMVYLKMNL